MRARKVLRYGFTVLICVVLMQSESWAGQWYKGDLHSHSLYSDGDSSVEDVIAGVEARELDFFALTDHDNYMDGAPEHWFDAAYDSESTVLLYGVEWTTGEGHANVWAAQPFDYTALWQANLSHDPEAAVDAADAAGAIFSINHPVRIVWEYPVVEGIGCVEIWNGPMLVNANYKATSLFWDNILMQRRRITGVGGSDTHDLTGIIAPFTGHGNPTTWVYADSKDADAILAGIDVGRVSISYTIDAPLVDFKVDGNGDGIYESRIGDNIVSDGQEKHFKIDFVGIPTGNGDLVALPASIVSHLNEERLTFMDLLWFAKTFSQIDADELQFITVIKDAQLFKAWLVSGGTNMISFSDTVFADVPVYYRVESFSSPDVDGLSQLIYGLRTAVTNPIYFNY